MDTKIIKKNSRHINSAINKHTTEHGVHVWRGLHGDLIPQLKQGKNYSDKGFTSTSINPSTSHVFAHFDFDRSFSHVAHIKVPKGSKALFLPQQDLSKSSHENELLLSSGSKFKYEGSELHKDPTKGQSRDLMVHHFTHIPKAPKAS